MLHNQDFQPTVIRSMEALINGKIVKVEQLKGNEHKQHIYYRVSIPNVGVSTMSSDSFWQMNPTFIRYN